MTNTTTKHNEYMYKYIHICVYIYGYENVFNGKLC